MKKVLLTLFIFSLTCICSDQLFAQKKIKTMIVTGQEGAHWWEGGSDGLRQILVNSGLFSVDMAITPPRNEDISSFNPDFKKYDLVVFSYGGKTFSEKTRKSFEEYVANGGGVVLVHASVIPFSDWPAFNEIAGMGGWGGRNEKDGPYVYWKEGRIVYDYAPGSSGYHGLQHSFTITHRQPDHPILKGLPVEWLHFKDELYAKMRGPAKNMQVLATTYDVKGDNTRHEPMLWTVNYGKGKVFVTLMGHAGNDPELRYSMECTGFQVTLLRGAEWAATGQVTQEVPEDFPSKGVTTLRKGFKVPDNL
ncbi:ThuA domain-containing protein [Parabacteroides sp. PF5-9]|uniref:ThuA domain-containing protein n=1 Tax=Parabacteroides sp. PF5-9 TaxID=1742404 RepID=UPI002475F4B0|nr:ThuA domain-containing protein [Parabacteroides sp. PF5-9]MDH6358888.1 type 1 glutamine amidotransferase [Parabacteroides sp. PF5-9]